MVNSGQKTTVADRISKPSAPRVFFYHINYYYNMKMNMSEIAKRAGVNRTTLYRWKKEGVLESELAKLGVGIEPETAEKPKGILEGGDLSKIELKPLTPEQEEVY